MRDKVLITSRYWLEEVARHGNDFRIHMAVNIAG
jgi:hypothetical protein